MLIGICTYAHKVDGALQQADSLYSLRHHHDIFHGPQKIRHARFHRGPCLDGRVNLHEVVDHEIERNRVHVVFEFLAECIGQPGKAAHAHAHRQIGALRSGWCRSS